MHLRGWIQGLAVTVSAVIPWIQSLTAPTVTVRPWIQPLGCILPSTCRGGREPLIQLDCKMHLRSWIWGSLSQLEQWASESRGLWNPWIQQLPIYTQVNQLICKLLVCLKLWAFQPRRKDFLIDVWGFWKMWKAYFHCLSFKTFILSNTNHLLINWLTCV